MTKLDSPAAGMLSMEEYVDIKGEIEAGCFESEVKLTNELRKLIKAHQQWCQDQGLESSPQGSF